MELREQFVAEARKYLGTPWKHQGRSFESIDCAGLVVTCAQGIGVEVQDDTKYTRIPDEQHLLSVLQKNELKLVSKANMQVGDIAIFRYDGNAQHLAIVSKIDKNEVWIIHSASTYGKVVEHPITKDWREKVAMVFRFKEFF